MAPLWFDPPVSVEGDRPGLTIVVSSVERAAEQLLTWPADRPAHRVAAEACMAAMEGRGSAAAARAAFVAAAKENDRWIDG